MLAAVVFVAVPCGWRFAVREQANAQDPSWHSRSTARIAISQPQCCSPGFQYRCRAREGGDGAPTSISPNLEPRIAGSQADAAAKNRYDCAHGKNTTATITQIRSGEIIMAKKPKNEPTPAFVSEQTAGGITGAVIGGMVAGPMGAVVGGVAGAMVGNSSAKGDEPVKKAIQTVRAAGRRGAKAVKAARLRNKSSGKAKQPAAKPSIESVVKKK